MQVTDLLQMASRDTRPPMDVEQLISQLDQLRTQTYSVAMAILRPGDALSLLGLCEYLELRSYGFLGRDLSRSLQLNLC
jgi:hypothetical protein